MGEIVDTGIRGGTLFDFAWTGDELSSLKPPMRYGRVDVDYGGEKLASGLIILVTPAVNQETGALVENTWLLRITVGPPDASAVAKALLDGVEMAVRVHS